MNSTDNTIYCIGLGHIGLVVALTLQANTQLPIIAIEKDIKKIKQIRKQLPPFYEPHLTTYLRTHTLTLQTTIPRAFPPNAVIIICVDTPPQKNGLPNTRTLSSILKQLAKSIKISKGIQHIIVKSTCPIGYMRKKALPLFHKYDLIEYKDFSCFHHPEFLREGNAFSDFLNPSPHVVGYNTKHNIPQRCQHIFKMFPNYQQIKFVDFSVSESIKYLNNTFHALKTAFSNEFFSIAANNGIDTEQLYDIFIADHNLNISKKYLRPGFAFGGSCLNKDLQAITSSISDINNYPIINSIIKSNHLHAKRLDTIIKQLPCKKILFAGVTFKEDTDDLRFSPLLECIHRLEKNYHIQVLDHPMVLDQLAPKFVEPRNNGKQFERNNDIELVILGPYKLSKSQLLKIIRNEIYVLDLLWHDYKHIVKNYHKYIRFI